jgi:murein DD-endopeptidase MepM/ murein hydrolase activator NlpD
LTLAIRPVPVLIALTIILTTPVIWLGGIIHSLHQKNHDLAERNHELSEAATTVIQDLETLDAEIEALRERAGMDDSTANISEERSPGPQGGVSVRLQPETLFKLAKNRLPELSAHLHQRVKPALNETLDEEAARAAARPKGRPVAKALRISSGFGLRRNPFGRGYEFHNGLDFPGPIGTPIQATAPGVIEKAEWSRGYGYHVVVNHGYGYRTLYAHLSETNVSQGDQVEKGHVVGYLGNTGRSTGPHLHYAVYQGNQMVDPKDYLD